MMFNKIDIQTWNRKDSFYHYFDSVPCTYSMTVNMDITKFMKIVKESDNKFFPMMLYALSQIVNKHKEFRMDTDENNNIGYYDYSNPCYTIFHGETEAITNAWTEYNTDFETFLQNYNDDMSKYRGDYKNSKPLVGKNCFNVSCIPWTSFTGFNLNLQKGYDFLPPIFTIGKYFYDDDELKLPLAIQVHHSVCDGFHVSRFVAELQDYLNAFTLGEQVLSELA